jgi:CRAL/TRIO domain
MTLRQRSRRSRPPSTATSSTTTSLTSSGSETSSTTLDDTNDDSLSVSSREQAAVASNGLENRQDSKQPKKKKKRKKNRTREKLKSLSSLSSGCSGGSATSSSSTTLGRSLLLGLITFAAVLAAASSHESFFFDRFLFLGGGDSSANRRQKAGTGASAAAYIAPPHRHSPPPAGTLPQSSGASSASGNADNIALQVPPASTKTKRKNPFGRIIRKLLTRKQNKVGGAGIRRQQWFGSSWEEDASSHHKANPSNEKMPLKASSATLEAGPAFTASMAADLKRRFPTAYSALQPALTAQDVAHLHEYTELVRGHFSGAKSSDANDADWHKAVSSPHVAWGGDAPWWDKALTTRSATGGTSTTDLDRIEGGNLLYSYYRIMKAIHDHTSSKKKKTKSENGFDLSNVYFPLKKCNPPDGCSAAEAIDHTLQWRTSYQPWKVDAKVLRENSAGWMFVRGWSPTPDLAAGSTGKGPAEHGRHAILWARPGIHRAQDGDAWIRTVLHGADSAVAQSLRESAGRIGKFNAVIDVAGFEWGRSLPALATIQQTVAALQDHFPNRLGVVALLNLSRGAEIVVNLIKPWLTKDVRDKIHVLSVQDLPLLVEHESIPSWLGGPDTYEFNADEYYPQRVRF